MHPGVMVPSDLSQFSLSVISQASECVCVIDWGHRNTGG